MNENFIIESGHDELFERVRPLWEELREYHVQHSSYVVAGNEKAIEFYSQFGFYPRNVHLNQNLKT